MSNPEIRNSSFKDYVPFKEWEGMSEKDKKTFESLFNAIEMHDGKAGLSDVEQVMFNRLTSIFQNTGENKDTSLDVEDLAFAKAWEKAKEKGRDLFDFINNHNKIASGDDPDFKFRTKEFEQVEIPAETVLIHSVSDQEIIENGYIEGETVEGYDNIYIMTKEGAPDKYRVKIENLDTPLYVDTLDEAIETLENYKIISTGDLDTATKRQNIESLTKLFNDIQTYDAVEFVIAELNDAEQTGKYDLNDPDFKALTQKLLLTRDHTIISELNETLFENDPIATKTLSVLYQELLDKETKGERLDNYEFELKERLEEKSNKPLTKFQYNGGSQMGYIKFNETGVVWGVSPAYPYCNNPDLAEDVYSILDNSSLSSEEQIKKFLEDSRVKDDNAFKNELADHYFQFASLEQQKAIIELVKDDIQALGKIDLNNLKYSPSDENSEITMEEVEALYNEALKEHFKFDTPNEKGEFDTRAFAHLPRGENEWLVLFIDSVEETFKEILENCFVTEGEPPTTSMKDFRLFTAEEMKGFADIVARYGSEEQKALLVDMINLEDLESRRFANIIANRRGLEGLVRDKLGNLVDECSQPREVIDIIDNLEFKDRIPADKIMEKFGEDKSILHKLMLHTYDLEISDKNILKIVESFFERTNNSYSLKKLPSGVTKDNILGALYNSLYFADASEVDKTTVKKLINALLESIDIKKDKATIKSLIIKAEPNDTEEFWDAVNKLIKNHPEDMATILLDCEDYLFGRYAKIFPPAETFGENGGKIAERVVAYYHEWGINDADLENLVKKGYLSPEYDGDSDYPIYSVYGDSNTLIRGWKKLKDSNGNLFTTFQTLAKEPFDGGRKLHEQVKGPSSNSNTLKLIIMYANEKDIVSFITGFNSKDGARIMEQLDDEWGIEAKSMNRIPQALLDYIDSIQGLYGEGSKVLSIKDSHAYKELKSMLDDYRNYTGDYDKNDNDARKMDNLICELLLMLERVEHYEKN